MRKKLEIEVRTITPHLAAEMLGNSFRNRDLSKSRIKSYAAAMRRGEWVVGDPLILDREGRLLEGRHRLHALIAASKAISFAVVQGVDAEETFGKLGTGARWGAKDWFGTREMEEPGNIAAALAYLYKFRRGENPGSFSSSTQPSIAQQMELLEIEPDIAKVPTWLPKKTLSRILPRSRGIFLGYLFACKDETLAKAFFSDLATGERLSIKDPVYMLREKLVQGKNPRQRLKAAEQMAYVIKAWNLVRKGKTAKILIYRSFGPAKEAFPQPE